MKISVSLLLCFFIFFTYILFGSNTGEIKETKYLLIHENDHYEEVLKNLQDNNLVNRIYSFRFFANLVGYKSHVRPGRYIIKPGMSNFSIVRMLRAGHQSPVKLVINKLRTEHDLISFLAQNLEPDSNSYQKLLNDSIFARQIGTKKGCGVCIIIPDTYELWWNTHPDDALIKLANYYKKFWDEERIANAEKLGFSPLEIMTLASIVEEETNNNLEKPLIASVYINRLKRGMRLQADPTARYAIGDFTVKRINSEIINTASPYNTYYTSGLPPSPICTPSQVTIDAVLHADSTNYIYFCAKEDFSGQHNFAENYEQHQQNAIKYQRALDAKGIH